eukprot:9337328-Heterocapsa_arctica.AAC.1
MEVARPGSPKALPASLDGCVALERPTVGELYPRRQSVRSGAALSAMPPQLLELGKTLQHPDEGRLAAHARSHE